MTSRQLVIAAGWCCCFGPLSNEASFCPASQNKGHRLQLVSRRRFRDAWHHQWPSWQRGFLPFFTYAHGQETDIINWELDRILPYPFHGSLVLENLNGTDSFQPDNTFGADDPCVRSSSVHESTTPAERRDISSFLLCCFCTYRRQRHRKQLAEPGHPRRRTRFHVEPVTAAVPRQSPFQ